MKLRITKKLNEANLVTHSGTFHPDDVFSTMFLANMIDNSVVIRVSDTVGVNSNAIIYDIGYGEFDHHGPDALYRNKDLKYSSFGLLWKRYGLEYLNSINVISPSEMFKAIDEKLVMQIDGIDNGVFPKVEAPYKLMDLDKVIDLFNKNWDDNTDNDDNFMLAVEVAQKIFDRIIIRENALLKANKLVEEEIDNVKDNILVLKEYMPYKDAIFNSSKEHAKDIKIVITPSNRGGYNIKPMTISLESKELVVHFNKEFLGLHNEELARVSGIKTARFVHSQGFIACAGTLDDAILLAKMALNNKE